MTIRLALMRHGHTQWNLEGKIQGRTDVPLTAEATQQLGGLELPAEWQGAAVVSSPLLRAHQTAQLITSDTVQVEPALTAMNWGDWEGKHGVQLADDPNSGWRHLEDWSWSYRPPAGESPEDVRDRVLPWVKQLRNDTVAICHMGVMRVLLALAHDWHFSGPPPFAVKRNRLFVLSVHDDAVRDDRRIDVADPAVVRLVKRAGSNGAGPN